MPESALLTLWRSLKLGTVSASFQAIPGGYMRTLHHFVRALIASVVLASGPTLADQIPGMGNLSGKVVVP